MGQLQMEVIACDGGVCSEEPSRLEDLLEGAYRLDPLGRDPFTSAGEETKAALVLAIQVHPGAARRRVCDQLRTKSLEVFLKAATASGSFFTCDLRATLHRAS